jgi:hypothetical protein
MGMTKAGWIKRKLNGNDIPWNKGIKLPQQSGKNNPLWKGDEVSYSALHHWLYRYLGKPNFCTFNRTHKGKYEWASITHSTKRDLKDYMSLCKFCHRKYDERDYSFLGKMSQKRKTFYNRWNKTWEIRKTVA